MSTPPTARILLVEDDPGMLVLATDRLNEIDGWHVMTAESAADCRRRVADGTFDVVLLDRGLPDCDGASLIRELLQALPETAIIMLTGADSAESATETLKLGAWDYIVKRPDLHHLEELPAVIRRSLERLRWKREEARLHSEMELMLTAIRGSGDAMIMADCERRVKFWNAAAEKLFGWRSEEVLGKPIPMVPPSREAESDELSQRASRGETLVGVETIRQRRDGSLVEVSLTLTAATQGDGSVHAYVAVMRDISERKALERARADFAAMLTHDIKNPLAVVRDGASLISESELQDDDRELLQGIEHAAETIDRLVSDFLMSATIEAGPLRQQRDRIAVADLICSTVDQFRTAAARQWIALEIDGGADGTAAGCFVCGDRLQLERALGNLINNAVKYTRPGGHVAVSAIRDAGFVRIEVQDTGFGISADELPYVFDKYRRVKGTERIDGSGLGLFIVRHLVETHGGSVSVRSEVGHGSTFTIALPLDVSLALAV
ncbi:MAG: PAS domain S-box protein [Deltaproteobacteria bacterium]|nr:PAS domain S-box protein [Deltaproteobacteria bacterium]